VRLIQGVAGEVSAHSSNIEAISADLRAAEGSLPDAQILLETAPKRILALNLALQEQLAKARQQSELLAAQLRARESEAFTDVVTSLLNRRAFETELRKQSSVWQRKNIPFTLLLLDLDQFKQFNDAHGHQAGDDVLRAIAQVIAGQVRPMDIAYRYGGEEFAVILPATEAWDGCLVAERIRQAIEHSVISKGDTQLKVTASVGVAAAIEADERERMIGRADEALYKAKQSGRNCVRWHNGREIQSLDSHGKPSAADLKLPRTQNSHPISFTALNRELTRHVCESRRSNSPLSLVCVRVEAVHTFEHPVDTIDGGSIFPAVIGLIREGLQATDLLLPIGAAELILVLPGCSQRAAVQIIKNCLDSQSGKELHRVHNFRLQYDACEILAHETAEELLVRVRESVLAVSSV
jgi:diguanylate cyclase